MLPTSYSTLINGVSSPTAKLEAARDIAVSGVYSPEAKSIARGYLISNTQPDSNGTTTYFPEKEAQQAPQTPQYNAYQSSVLAKLPKALQDIYASSLSNVSSRLPGMQASLNEYGYGQEKAQRDLNTQAIQNEMALKSGRAGVLSMVNKGLEQGGRMLASRNAGRSSAVNALARIYGKLGQTEMNKVGNQYETGNLNLANAQKDLEAQQDIYQQKFGASKEELVQGIVEAARSQLDALNAELTGASLTDRIDIQNEINKIKKDAQGQLATLDSMVSQKISGARGAKTSQESNRTEALRMMAMGQAPAQQFAYRADIAPTMGGPVAAASNLPIYTLPRKKTNTQGV